MKKLVFILVVLSLSISTYSQDNDFKTIFNGADLRISGFGGPMMSFTSLDGEFTHMMGGGGAVLIGDFFVGGYGMGKTNNIRSEKLTTIDDVNIDFGHGGFWLGYVFMSKKAIHPVFHSMIGWGEISHNPEMGYLAGTIQSVSVFVFIPTVEMEMNFTRYFKVGLGASMTIASISNTSESSFSSNDLLSPGGFLSFKFGWF